MVLCTSVRKRLWLPAVLGVLVLVVPAGAQERGEEIVGKIAAVDGLNLTIEREDAPPVHVRVSEGTEVRFTDRGDRRLFPDPNVRDLRPGMGVRFVSGPGVLDRIAVHYVPAEMVPRAEAAAPREIKARVSDIKRGGGEIVADVAGRKQSFRVEPRSESARVRKGDLVLLTLDRRGNERVVTRIETAAKSGRVVRFDEIGNTITIESGGQQQTYGIEKRDLFRSLRDDDEVIFEVEERNTGARVVTAIRRLR